MGPNAIFPIFAAELLGFDKYIEPFATVKGVEMFRGVNYASGAAGILDESGIHLVILQHIPFLGRALFVFITFLD